MKPHPPENRPSTEPTLDLNRSAADARQRSRADRRSPGQFSQTQGLALIAVSLVLLGVTGCRSIGPGTVKRDRLHYSAAVAESWKEQLLLNIVKSRYGDAPAFLEVSSMVSGYSLETGVSINGQFSPENLRGDSFASGAVSGKFTDRPTISYSPLTGERFARSLLAAVPLEALMFVLQGGAPADFLLGLTVQSFEGHFNQGIFGGRFEPGDASFDRLLGILRIVQQSRAAESEVVKRDDRYEVWLHFRSRGGHEKEVAELKSLLQVPAEASRVQMVFGVEAPEPEVVAVRTRSLLQILNALGAGVQVPEEHVTSGRALMVTGATETPRLTVHSGAKKPEAAFAAVPYEGMWFWIAADDLASKTTLSAVTLLFSFLDNSGTSSAPVLTIPTN